MTYSAEVLADSPLAYYRLGEASGTTMTDSSGNGRNGTYSGGVTLGVAGLLTGDANTAADFNGSTQYGDITDGAWMDVTTVTLEAWIKPDDLSALRFIVARDLGNFDGDNGRFWHLRVTSDGKPELIFWASDGGSAQFVTGPTALTVGTRYHLAGTYDGSVGRLYVNGSQVATASASGAIPILPNAAVIRVAGSPPGGQFFDGVIDEVAIYSGALSATRIAVHYAAGASASLYMPDVQVEIAFNAGVRTAAADRVWTDVSTYAELDRGVDIDAWRADEFSTCDANTLRLTLDNRDGRFTPGRAASPYYPNVKIGRPIRVTATPVGGSASVRFVGFIDEWPLEWDGSDQNAYSQVAATSRLARLGNDRKLRSIVEEEILLDSPLAYYPLSEAAGATSAADASGSPSPASLVQKGSGAAVTFGTATGPSTDGLTAASLTGGKHLGLTSPTALATEVSGITIECFLNTSGSNDQVMEAWTPIDAESVQSAADIAIDGSGRVTSSGGTIVGPTVADGLTHHAAVSVTAAGSYVLYSDGASAGSGTLSIGSPVSLSVGANPFGGNAFVGTLAHAAIFNSAVSASRIAAHADAGRTGFAGETPGARFARYASYAGIPAAEVDADAGTSPMAHIDTTDKTVLELLRTVETTEGGVLFDGRDGTLEFRSRSSRYLAASAFTLSVTSQQVEAGMSPKLDRSAIQNDVTATLADGTVTARATNATSVSDYGTKGDDLELATTDTTEPHSAAWWRVNTYAEPTSRVPALAVEILALDAATQALVLAAEPGTRFTVTGLPSQAASSTGDYFVEGASESVSPESYVVTFNVSDATPYVNTLVLDSATRGLLDTNRLAY